jgi:hypothetical protein
LSLLHSVRTSPGAHTISFPGAEADHLSPSSAVELCLHSSLLLDGEMLNEAQRQLKLVPRTFYHTASVVENVGCDQI